MTAFFEETLFETGEVVANFVRRGGEGFQSGFRSSLRERPRGRTTRDKHERQEVCFGRPITPSCNAEKPALCKALSADPDLLPSFVADCMIRKSISPKRSLTSFAVRTIMIHPTLATWSLRVPPSLTSIPRGLKHGHGIDSDMIMQPSGKIAIAEGNSLRPRIVPSIEESCNT